MKQMAWARCIPLGTPCHTPAEKGVDMRYTQQLLGHESSKTTEIYTHITHKGRDTIKSPIDDFYILKIFFVRRFARQNIHFTFRAPKQIPMGQKPANMMMTHAPASGPAAGCGGVFVWCGFRCNGRIIEKAKCGISAKNREAVS